MARKIRHPAVNRPVAVSPSVMRVARVMAPNPHTAFPSVRTVGSRVSGFGRDW